MKTLALDLDGTLLDCEARHCALMRQVCRMDALQGDFIAHYWAAKREGASNLQALQALGHPAAADRAAAWARDIEHWPWLGFDRLLPGVVEALALCTQRIVVLTARRAPALLRQQLDRLALSAAIDELVVVPPSDAVAAKADALRRLQPRAFVGDTESDAAAATRAGTAFLAVDSGMRSPRFWQARATLSHPHLSAALATLTP